MAEKKRRSFVNWLCQTGCGRRATKGGTKGNRRYCDECYAKLDKVRNIYNETHPKKVKV